MDCKLRAKNCGGCPMLGMDYAAQLKQKEETVKKLLGKYGPVEHIRGMETPYHYRNKVISTFTLLRMSVLSWNVTMPFSGSFKVPSSS